MLDDFYVCNVKNKFLRVFYVFVWEVSRVFDLLNCLEVSRVYCDPVLGFQLSFACSCEVFNTFGFTKLFKDIVHYLCSR